MNVSAGLLFLTLLAGEPGLERVGRLEDPAIREASGILASRRHPGIFWVHNDSGNLSQLFAVKRNGSLVRTYLVKVPNIDWEDIANDPRGRLYLGEIGNNDGRLPIRAIHRLAEPDPSGPPGPTMLTVEATTYYRFPPDGRFDAEALYVDQGRALIVAKSFDQSEARLHAVPLEPPAPLWKPAIPEPAGTLAGFKEPVTGADLSSDGLRLAVCSYEVARVYRRRKVGEPWRCVATVPFKREDIEAICWDGDRLILASEGRDVYEIGPDVWRGGEDRLRGRQRSLPPGSREKNAPSASPVRK